MPGWPSPGSLRSTWPPRGLRVGQVAAKRGARRTRERTLWLLCLAGGVLGAWLAFFGLRHKTQHRSFWTVQSVATVAWLVIIVVLLTS